MRIIIILMVLLATVLQCLPVRASAQAARESIIDARSYRVRILWPPAAAVDSGVLAQLARAIRAHVPLVGNPDRQLAGGAITMSLATRLPAGVDAWASPDDHLISLSLDGVRRWSQSKLTQVVGHEMAHLELHAFLGRTSVPAWFKEGVSEWWAAGLTCEGKIRIRLDLMQRRRQGDRMPRLFSSEDQIRSRLAYDYLASYFKYIDVRSSGALADGRLLAMVRKSGVDSALTSMLGMNTKQAERAWWASVLQRSHGFLGDSVC